MVAVTALLFAGWLIATPAASAAPAKPKSPPASASPKSPAAAAPAPKDTAAVARVSIAQAIGAAPGGSMVIVDVRPPGQRSLGHIRGDIYVPLDQLEGAQPKLPRDKQLVLYCSCPAEEEALEGARILLKAGTARVAALVGGYDAWRAAGGPIQVDAPWEEIFKIDTPPAEWGKTPIDSVRCQYAVDDSESARGKASARITCRPDTTARGFAGYVQRIDARAVLGRTVTLTAMVRSQNLERGAFLWIGVEDAQGRFMRVTKPEQSLITGTHDWQESEVSGVVPPDAARVLIGVSVVASGGLWWDEVKLVAPEERGLPRVRVVVENASFEE